MTTVDVTIRISAKAEFGCQLLDDGLHDDLFKGDDFEDAIAKAINKYNDDFRLSDMVIETQGVKIVSDNISPENHKE